MYIIHENIKSAGYKSIAGLDVKVWSGQQKKKSGILRLSKLSLHSYKHGTWYMHWQTLFYRSGKCISTKIAGNGVL